MMRLDQKFGSLDGGVDCCPRVAPDAAMPEWNAESYIRLYLGPLPPSRGVHLGPSTSVALQSTQFGAFTRSAPCATSYTPAGDRKSTRLNSSHSQISYAVFCL